MGKVLLAGILALAASTSLAQTDPAAPAPTGAGGPANLCQELLAFMTPPPSGAKVAPASSTETKPAQSADAPAAPTGEESAPASGEAVPPQTAEKTGSAQEASGQSGPANEAPEPNSEPVKEGAAQAAELKSSLSAPAPTDATSTPKDSALSRADAERLAEANDIAACQTAARELRLAGVDMPAPLLALTALDLQYQQ